MASEGSRGPGRALITGITGQDGSFLAELLLEKGYEVWGVVHRDPAEPLGAVEHLREQLVLRCADLLDHGSLRVVVEECDPDELYHLAAPSFPPESWRWPAQTLTAIAGATATLLETVRDRGGHTRVYVASSGAIFGDAPESPQNERTPCRPKDPYAVAKLAAHQLVGALRGRDGLHASSGITFNHESERRPPRFVTRKVTYAAAAASLGLVDHVALGDLGAVRDWSFAGDVMAGAWLMLQQSEGDDYVLASGVGHTVGELAQTAFAHVGLEADRFVRVDPDLVRPREALPNVGDPSRARERLGWRASVGFAELVARMVDADLSALRAVGVRP